MYCEFTIDLMDKEQFELTGKDDTTHTVSIWINLQKITAITVVPADEKEYTAERTCIYMEGGESFTVNSKIQEVMKIINKPFNYQTKGLLQN